MKRKRLLKAATIRKLEGSVVIAPWFIGFLVFMAFPLGYSLYMSFHHVRITGAGIQSRFAGWEHYQFILFTNGGVLYEDLIPFLQEALLMIPIIIIFSLLVAIILNQKFYGRMAFRTIFFFPVIFSTGQVVNEFITQGKGGLGFLERYNVAQYVREWLSSTWADPVVSVMSAFVLILWYSGVQILIFLAGRQTISGSVYEAARIDGATPWEAFWKITLPGMLPFILLNIIYTVVDLFTFPGNPILSKVSTANYGQSSALAWIYFAMILTFLAIVFVIFNRVTRNYRPANH